MSGVRFAPSPTGRLHIGNARAALLNALYARQHGVPFLLRIDDTDTERTQPAFVEAIKEDLAWLGLSWDNLVFQSARQERYQRAAEQLRAAGRLYPCYETPEELEFQRKIARSRGCPPIYDRAALALSSEQKKQKEAEGRRPYWRFLLKEQRVSWIDSVYGVKSFEGIYASDPVLVRADGLPVYTLASVVDDWELGITHVIRGADHLTNTAVQIQILEALEKGSAATISWTHYPLFRTRSGEELSKRTGSLSLQELREEGIHPLALCSFLAKIGTSDSLVPVTSLEALVESFSLYKISLAEAQFDLSELRHLNRHLLHDLPFSQVAPDFQEKGIPLTPAFWEAIRGNITTLKEGQHWWNICYGKIPPPPDQDPDFREACLLCVRRAPEAIEAPGVWETLVSDLVQTTGRRGRALFHPLRLLLTGQEAGPELRLLASILGKSRMVQRLARDDAAL
ncbi:MAG: glutamate--tRNA ligase [Holosporales bacterium]|jgi:glutamyl-tRNA synthetase|nr:glutamate--tRNA ligase [Holosporales bacterium]